MRTGRLWNREQFCPGCPAEGQPTGRKASWREARGALEPKTSLGPVESAVCIGNRRRGLGQASLFLCGGRGGVHWKKSLLVRVRKDPSVPIWLKCSIGHLAGLLWSANRNEFLGVVKRRGDAGCSPPPSVSSLNIQILHEQSYINILVYRVFVFLVKLEALLWKKNVFFKK